MSRSYLAAVVGVFGTLPLAIASVGCGGGSGAAATADGAVTPHGPDGGDATRDTRAADRPIDAAVPIVIPDAGPPPSPPDAAPPDMGCPDLGTGDAPDAPPAAIRPTLASLVPTTGAAGQAVPLSVLGSGFDGDLTVLVGGQRIAGTRTSALLVTAQVPATALPDPGQYAIQVESKTAGVATLTNILYFTVPPAAPDAPVLVGYNPDNGAAGDTVVLVGRNLTAEPLQIAGTGGAMATPGAAGMQTWSGEMLQSLSVTLPMGWQTGPVTVTNTKGKSRGPIFWASPNLSRAPTGVPTASSEYGGMWTIPRGADNDLATSWFAAMNNNAASRVSCLGPPFYIVAFAAPQSIAHIALRGNREYPNGYDFLRGRFEILDAAGASLYVTSVDLPNPDRDYDLFLAKPASASAVRFISEQDEGIDPGFADLEIFAN
jgi:hypothetical protein